MPCLAICGARDTNGEARLELSELQKDDGQVMNEEQSIHQGHGVLDDSLIVLILRIMMFTWHFKEPQQEWFSFECWNRNDSALNVYDGKGMNKTTPPLMQRSVYIYRNDSWDILQPPLNFILAHLRVKDSDSIEEPVRPHKQQH